MSQKPVFLAGTSGPSDATDALGVADIEREFIARSEVASTVEVASSKLDDAMTPGYQAEFDPAEAEAVGAFPEDALSEADAFDSTHD